MPNHKHNKKSQRKQRKRAPKTVHPFTMKVAPVSKAVYKFVYTEAASLGAAATAGAHYTFSLNNLYDPNISGTGYQPIGFDQMCQFWLNYRVLSVRIRLDFSPNPGATETNRVGYYPSGLSTMPADYNAWLVQPFAKTAVLSSSGGPGVKTMTDTIRPWQVLGITRNNYMSENDYLSSSTGGPLRPIYLHTFAQAIGKVDTACGVRVFLEYEVLASQPVALGMS